MAYDAADELLSTTDRILRRVDYASYDRDGEKKGETWVDSGGTTVNILTFTYRSFAATKDQRDFLGMAA
jgi:hypothetical protein